METATISKNEVAVVYSDRRAELNRECIRVNISIETDESDLLGGPTLVNGNVVNGLTANSAPTTCGKGTSRQRKRSARGGARGPTDSELCSIHP